ncbi:5-hydroxyisourate hydrolase [Aliidongia dinghuensis]|uniref:5-hydroxyisourate hydrolase n=1 Tax=Aliidongia dinghuensis TaxID=1867774 RepID=A0A8J2YQ67_9PROT|nr:hydroxyisourate hydrolase [Aliidongia dinghuensis]GGF05929.1 5-hydroxyisourate hydrolase [Aliidongia dinghuensis]
MSSGRLTIHALDTSLGRPAAGLVYQLFRLDGPERTWLASGRTNADGRGDGALLAGADLVPGLYEILFEAGAYQKANGMAADALFYDQVPIRFRVGDPAQNYHVPLILARYGYTTYRGS